MVIHSLEVTNFRNYKTEYFEFNRANIIYGNNGQGKTNLLEAVYFLTHLRSFRTNFIKNLLLFNKEIALIEANLTLNSIQHTVKISLLKDKKKVLLDNKPITLVSDYISRLFSLIFAPDILSSFKNLPSERRNFLDRSLILLLSQYSLWLKEYNHIRKQKNKLLKIGTNKDITVWNKLFAKVSLLIKEQRQKLCEELNLKIPGIFQNLTGKDDLLKIQYKTVVGETEEDYFCFLESKQEYEQTKGFAMYGSHRDTLFMTLNGKEESVAFSQGEYRISYLAILLGLNEILKEKKQILPIILLDDIFSELDKKVIDKTVENLLPINNQIFITSVTKSELTFSNMKQLTM